jgi:hypothetical protein
MTTWPSAVRTVVTRSVTSSTVLIAGLAGWHREADEVPETVLAFSDDEEEADQDVLDDALRTNLWPTATTSAGATRLVLGMPRRPAMSQATAARP